MHIDRPPHVLTGDSIQELFSRAAAMGAEAAPAFTQGETLELRDGRTYRVGAFDEEGMTVEPVNRESRPRGQLRLGDFVKVRGFWFKVIQERLGDGFKLAPWGYPTAKGGPPAKSFRETAELNAAREAEARKLVEAKRELEEKLERRLAAVDIPVDPFSAFRDLGGPAG